MARDLMAGRMESVAVALIAIIAAGPGPWACRDHRRRDVCGGNGPEDFAVARERVYHSLSVGFRFGILKAALARPLN